MCTPTAAPDLDTATPWPAAIPPLDEGTAATALDTLPGSLTVPESKTTPHGPKKPHRIPKAANKRRVKALVALFVVALVLTAIFAAGIATGAYLIGLVMVPEAAGLPMPFGAVFGSSGGLATAVLAVRFGAAKYSKHTYPHFSCEACKGSGKNFEPKWLRLLRWGRRRAWRKCPTCDGNPTEDR